MGSNHKSRNIPRELEDLLESLLASNAMRSDAVDDAFLYIADNIRSLRSTALREHKAQGLSSLRRYREFFFTHSHEATPTISDQVVVESSKLLLALCAYTHSTASCRAMSRTCDRFLDALYDKGLVCELNTFAEEIPNLNFHGSLETRWKPIRSVLDTHSKIAKSPVQR